MGCNCKKVKNVEEIPLAVSSGYAKFEMPKKSKAKLIILFILFLPLIIISFIIRRWKKVTG